MNHRTRLIVAFPQTFLCITSLVACHHHHSHTHLTSLEHSVVLRSRHTPLPLPHILARAPPQPLIWIKSGSCHPRGKQEILYSSVIIAGARTTHLKRGKTKFRNIHSRLYISTSHIVGQRAHNSLAQSTNRRCVFMPGGPKVSYGCVSSVLPLPRARPWALSLLTHSPTHSFSAMVGPQGDRCASAAPSGIVHNGLDTCVPLSSHWTRTHRQ